MDLGNHAGGARVAPEDLRVAAQGNDPFLDAGAARVVEAHQRGAVLEREVHHLADLLRVHAAQAAAQHGEVLREDVDEAALDGAPARHHAVAQEVLRLHPEVVAVVLAQRVQLHERAGVKQQVDALAGGVLARLVLPLDALRAAALEGVGLPPAQVVHARLDAHAGPRRRVRFKAGAPPARCRSRPTAGCPC
jgi:hypothetical protein